MKGKTLWIIFIFMLFFTSMAHAQPYEAYKEEFKAMVEQRMAEHIKEVQEFLNISEEQRVILAELHQKHRGKMRYLHNNLKKKKIELKVQLQRPDLDIEAIHLKHNEIKALTMEMLDLRLQSILEVRKVLTSEQFQLMEEFLKEKGPHQVQRPSGGHPPMLDSMDF